jgi:hypothetical protein
MIGCAFATFYPDLQEVPALATFGFSVLIVVCGIIGLVIELNNIRKQAMNKYWEEGVE